MFDKSEFSDKARKVLLGITDHVLLVERFNVKS